jgi:hypothetical protein
VMITDIGSPSSSVQLETIPFCLAGHFFDFQFDTWSTPSMKFRRFFPI